MYKTLEHHEHASHIAHEAHGHEQVAEHGATEHANKRLFSAQLAALLVATLAAGLALSEQGAKHAEIKVQANLIAATDAWAQYQAKSTRSTLSRDVVALIGVLGSADPDVADRRKQVIAELNADQERYEKDPKDGREAVAERAHEYEHARDHALEQTHAYHNGSASMELGIVLATASAIIGSRLLFGMAALIGAIGMVCAAGGYFSAEWAAF
jgi:Domain of unknown function (DUF4337)